MRNFQKSYQKYMTFRKIQKNEIETTKANKIFIKVVKPILFFIAWFIAIAFVVLIIISNFMLANNNWL